jgi:hypothetical protein
VVRHLNTRQRGNSIDLFLNVRQTVAAALAAHQVRLQLASLARIQLTVEITAQREQAALHMAISR